MFLRKLKSTAAVMLIAVSLIGGAGMIYRTQAAEDTGNGGARDKLFRRADKPAGAKGDTDGGSASPRRGTGEANSVPNERSEST